MNPHLFVYGTLLSAAGHPMGARLQREARLIGEASTQGRLYRLGKYPGLVEAADANARVLGEVFALNNAAASLEWLDAYEGIVPGNLARNEYERVERPVRLATGEEVTAWVYLCRKDVTRLPEIPGGRWPGG
jgi:gamma-glutamylcyclotransferase (GGCT)/AIG2-like uncharacterized protein YtfP